ncbi:hypothetical protein [Candidatus Poriferisodalis sp.]|uniref:hypothetical protein n=1 Tax=Candidatus Poriferisodalis sp. TaxID=3101277 RepID=UPI003B52FEF0
MSAEAKAAAGAWALAFVACLAFVVPAAAQGWGDLDPEEIPQWQQAQRPVIAPGAWEAAPPGPNDLCVLHESIECARYITMDPHNPGHYLCAPSPPWLYIDPITGRWAGTEPPGWDDCRHDR